MSTSLDSEVLPSISRSEYLSSLPRWRRWLSMLNWHPVVDYEIRAIEFENRRIEFEKRRIEHERRMQRLKSEIAQIEKETEQLKSENAREAELNARIAALWSNSSTSSTPAPKAGNDSPT